MRALPWTQKVKIAWMVLLHPKTPFAAKATILGGLFYGVMPFDLLPILGVMDDATLFIIAIVAFLRLTRTIRQKMEQEQNIIDVKPL